MFIDIREIMHYGEYYSFDDYGKKYDVFWWLSLIDYSVINIETLCEKYSYHSCEEILEAGLYIPFFRTDILDVEREFIKKYYPYQAKKIFNNELDLDNHIAFMKFAENNYQEESFYSYRDERLARDAVKWCCENHLKYKE